METLEQCPVCNASDPTTVITAIDHHLTQEAFRLAGCPSCGFLFTNPRPKSNDLGRYYASANYISHNNSGAGLVAKLYYQVRRFALNRKRAMIAQLGTGRRLLDFGCGSGSFLAYMHRSGYSVAGVEPSDTARAAALATSQNPIVRSLDDLGEESFDIITLWHVLEHVPDPSGTLRRLSKRLAPSAYLLVAVPDRTSWDADHYKAHWAALDVPRHLSHFRPVDVLALADRSGLREVSRRRLWLDAFYISMLSERYRGRGVLLSFLLGLLLGSVSNLVSLVTGRSSSSTLYIFRKKAETL